MIEFKNIYKSYNDKNVINNLNLVVILGEIVGLIGHNVAVKTTTLKILTGILKSDKGEILINKKDIYNHPLSIKMNMGFVSGNYNIFLKLKGIEYLNFICDMYNISTEERRKQIIKYSLKFQINGLDPHAINSLKQIIKDYSNKGKTIIFLIHILDIAEKICNRIIILHKGNIIYDSKFNDPKQIKYSLVEEAFIKLTNK